MLLGKGSIAVRCRYVFFGTDAESQAWLETVLALVGDASGLITNRE